MFWRNIQFSISQQQQVFKHTFRSPDGSISHQSSYDVGHFVIQSYPMNFQQHTTATGKLSENAPKGSLTVTAYINEQVPALWGQSQGERDYCKIS